MNARFPRRRHGGVLALALAQAFQQAAAQEAPLLAMASVEIIGSAPVAGLGVERKLLPYPLQTVSDSTLDRAQSDNLSGFMARNLTGVNVNEISGSPFQNDITYRGFRASPVLGTSQGISVYLDGVRVNEPFGDVINWDMIPESAIGTVLLVPGSNPLYGLNTLGGALALASKSGRSHPGFEGELTLGRRSGKRLDLAHGSGGTESRNKGSFHHFVAATLFDDAGWREHSPGRLGNVFAKVGGGAGATEWSLSLLGGKSRLQGNGLLPSYRWVDGEQRGGLYEDNRRASYTFPDQTRNRLAQATLNLIHRIDAASELTVLAYGRSSRRDTVNGDIGEAYDDYVDDCGDSFHPNGAARDESECGLTRAQGAALHAAVLNTTSTRQRGQGASANLSLRRGTHHIDAGATFDRSSVRFAQYEQEGHFTPDRGVLADPDEEREATSSVNGTSRAIGFYAADTWTMAPGTHVTATARYNYAVVSNTLTSERGLQPSERFSYRRLNPSLGVVRDLNPALAVFANLAQSNRVPTVIELGCADPEHPCQLPVGLQSDPYLKQVVSRTLEAGARWQGRDATLPMSLSASLYRTVNRDDILFLSSGASRQGYFSNFARTRHQGLDLSATIGFARISYSFLDAVYDAAGEVFTGPRTVRIERGARIAGLPRHTLKIGMDWNWTPALTVGLDAQATSSLVTQGNEDGLREDREEGEEAARADWRIRGHGLLNLRANWKPAAGWELFARINNVFDKRYETFGAIAPDLFPNGQQLKPHEGAVEAGHARFVAPGAARSISAGLRYRF